MTKTHLPFSRRLSASFVPGSLDQSVPSGAAAAGRGSNARIEARFPSSPAIAVVAALGLAFVAPTSSHAQAPPLGTTANFSVLAGAGITNTGPTVITGTAALPGDLGSATATIGGFPPGTVTAPGVIHAINDGPTITALNSLTTAYNNLAGRTALADLTGQNLGGLTLIPGV